MEYEGDKTKVEKSLKSPELSLLSEESLDDAETLESWNENGSPERVQSIEEHPTVNSPLRTPRTPQIRQPMSPTTQNTPQPMETSPSGGTPEYSQNLEEILEENSEQDQSYIQVLQQLSPYEFTEKIKQVEDWAYKLGLMEAKELERGKVLDILASKTSPKKQTTNGSEKTKDVQPIPTLSSSSSSTSVPQNNSSTIKPINGKQEDDSMTVDGNKSSGS